MTLPLSIFKALADDTRLKSLLLISLQQELCVCDLQQALALSQPKISRHLAELRQAGLVLDERRGKWVYYRLNPDAPAWLPPLLAELCQQHADYVAEASLRLNAGQCCDEEGAC